MITTERVDVKTKAEAEKAIKAGHNINIIAGAFALSLVDFSGSVWITAGSPRIVTRETSSPRIVTRETSSPRIVTWETSSPRIETRGTSSPRIVTRETSSPSIETWGTSSPSIETRGTSSPSIETRGTSSPRIVTRETSSPRIETRETSSPSIETRETSSPSIETWGTSSPRIETRGTSSPSIETRGTSSPSIETRGTSSPRIVTRETSSPSIVTRETSSPSIVTRETSSPSIETWGTSSPRIETRETSSPSIETWGTSSPRIDANGYSYVFLKGDRLTGTASANVLIRIQGAAKIEGGQQFVISLSSAQDWCEFYGAKIEGDEARVYKAVKANYRSYHGGTYTPGTSPRDPMWDDKGIECSAGGGLNFSPTPRHTHEFECDPVHYLECWVRLDEMVCHFNGRYPQKVCAPEVSRPLIECDVNGEHVVSVEAQP